MVDLLGWIKTPLHLMIFVIVLSLLGAAGHVAKAGTGLSNEERILDFISAFTSGLMMALIITPFIPKLNSILGVETNQAVSTYYASGSAILGSFLGTKGLLAMYDKIILRSKNGGSDDA